MKAVFLDSEGLDDLSLRTIEQECDSLHSYPYSPAELVSERIADADIIILNKVKISRQLLNNHPKIKLICLVATGADVIDMKAAADLGVTVCNCQAYGTDSVVQHVFSVMLALHTNLLSYSLAVREGRWQNANQFCFLDYPIVELRGKTLGIVGYGTLGRGVAAIAHAFGMRVLLCRRPGGAADARPTLEELLPQADILTLHCPLTEATRGLIGSQELERMKPSAFLINCARGGLVNEQALVHALQSGTIQGAAVDVLSLEPPKHGNPLLNVQLPNLLVTPHIAWASTEARQRIIKQTAENIRAFKERKTIRQISVIQS